jgi:hypothetical protein
MTEGNKKTFEHVDKVIAAVNTFADVVRYSEHKFHWERMQTYARALFDRAPFKPGDRVRITKDPNITQEKSWGWMGAKHFLVVGALGTVRYVDFYDGHFCADVIWDDESWISSTDKTLHPVPLEDRALYRFWETKIERVPSEPSSTEQK